MSDPIPNFYPKRFARMFQIHPDFRGTPEQRELVEVALTYEFGTVYDAANKRLARAVKDPEVSVQRWVNIKFRDLGIWLGHCQPYNISLSTNLAGLGVINIAHHEYGHLFAMWAMTWEEKQAYIARKGITGAWPDADETFAIDMEGWMKGWPQMRWMDKLMSGEMADETD